MKTSNIGYNPFADNNIVIFVNEMIKKAIAELQTCIPVIVKEVKSREQVVVSPAVQKTSPNWDVLPWADIVLPVYTPQGSKGLMSFPVAVGDTGWVIAGDLDPSLFFQDTTKPARQNVFDRHNYQYGFFLPCKMKNFGIDSADDGGIVIKNGNTKIVVKENEIDIVSANALKINAKSVNITSSGNNIEIDGVNFKNHTHSVGSLEVPVTSAEGSPSTITGNTGGVN